jgi:hypothetical protein
VNSVRLNLNVCTRPHDCIVLLWPEAIACANKVLLYYCWSRCVVTAIKTTD